MKKLAYENELGQLYYEVHPEIGIFIHVDLDRWGKREYLQVLKIFSEFMDYLHELGCEEIFAAIDFDDEKLQKFATMFGFYDSGLVLKNNTDETDKKQLWKYTWENLNG